jgi:hypothetical protein
LFQDFRTAMEAIAKKISIMMSMEQIALQFPPQLRLQRQAMLREYLQCVILEIVFDSDFASKLSFLGGTCLSLVHGNTRFSKVLIGFSNKTISK